MKKKFSSQRIVAYVLLTIFSMLCIFMLCFSTMYASKVESKVTYPIGDNGFVWMGLESNIAYGEDWDAFKIPLALISINQLIFGFVAIGITIFTFLRNCNDKLNLLVIIGGLSFMTLYAIEGWAYKTVYCTIMWYDTMYFATSAYIPLLLGIPLVIGYFIFIKNAPCIETDDALQKQEKMSESERIHDINIKSEMDTMEILSKYGELNRLGVISDEEFASKKEQLMGQ